MNEKIALAIVLSVLSAFSQPVITCQPQNQTNVAGATAMFSVCATGTPPLNYQWRSHASVSVFTNIPWGTDAALLLTNVQPTTRRFGVVVSNSDGSVTSVLATLTVLWPPTITEHPASQSAGLCATVTFSLTATSSYPIAYQWRFNDANLPGRTNRNLVLTNVGKADAGEYFVVVSNSLGVATSQVATLRVDSSLLTYSAIYAFGFSWTDTRGIGCNWNPPSYYMNRACNGPMWIEFLSTNLGLAYVDTNNFANCGDTAAEVLQQVANFSSSPAPERALYFVWSGASDFLNTSDFQNDALWNSRIQSMINDNTNAVRRLYAKGARDIVVQNCFDMSTLPQFIRNFGSNSPNQLKLRQRVVSFNAGLESAMNDIRDSRPDLRLSVVDIYSRLSQVLTNPAAYGLTKTFPDALSDAALVDKSFAGPGQDYVFWDALHPTSKAHRWIEAWNLEAITNARPERLALNIMKDVVNLQLKKLKACREYTIQRSTDLTNWLDAVSFVANAGTNQWSFSIEQDSAAFYRLKW